MTYKLRFFVEAVSESETLPQTCPYDRFVGLEHYDPGELEITRYTDTSLLSSSVKVFHKNDILVARRNVYLKRAGIVFFDGLTSGDSIILRVLPDCEHLTGIPFHDALKWLPIVLNSSSFWAYANKHADGMNSKRISKEMLLEYEFPRLSVNEVKDISSKVWAAHNLKNSYAKLLGATDEMVKSRFIEMFSTEPKMCLSEVANITMGSSPDSKYYNMEKLGLPFYQGKTEFGDLCIGEATVFCSEPVRIAEPGDILLSVRAPVGTVNLNVNKCCIGRGLASIRPKKDIEQLYLFYALRLKEADIDALGTGSTFKAINKETLFSFRIEVGKKERQNEFVLFAKQSDKSKFELKQAIEKIDKVMRALIQ